MHDYLTASTLRDMVHGLLWLNDRHIEHVDILQRYIRSLEQYTCAVCDHVDGKSKRLLKDNTRLRKDNTQLIEDNTALLERVKELEGLTCNRSFSHAALLDRVRVLEEDKKIIERRRGEDNRALLERVRVLKEKNKRHEDIHEKRIRQLRNQVKQGQKRKQVPTKWTPIGDHVRALEDRISDLEEMMSGGKE